MTASRRLLWAALLSAAIATSLAGLLTRELALLSAIENLAADLRIAAFQRPRPQSSEVVVVAIDEDTVRRFAYRTPIDRAFLADLLTDLDRFEPRAIGLDVLLDQPTEPHKDQALRRTIEQLRTPLVISHVDTPSLLSESGRDYLNRFVPVALRGAANLATDPLDGTVRWIFPGALHEGMAPGFARRLAERAGVPSPAEQQTIAWRARPDTGTRPFPVYPAHLVRDLPAEWLKGRVVLVGAILTMTDRHRTPLAIIDGGDDGMMPGILIQAHSVSQLLEGGAAQRAGLASSLLVNLLAGALGLLLGLSRRGLIIKLLASVSVLALLWVGATLGFSVGLPMIPLVEPTLALLLSLWMVDVVLGRIERQRRRFVQNAFSRYVSPLVVRQLIDDPGRLNVESRRQEAAFLFTDIAGFTQLSEQMPSEQLTAILNDYFEGACRVIFAHGGTVDKYIGDAIMVIFNAPIAQADFTQRALACAIELDRYAEAFRRAQQERGIPFGSTRIGVHCGLATIGNFGSQSRLEYTALGDTVNIAARCESANRFFGTRVCCTGEIVRQCPGTVFLPIGAVVMKGKQSAVELFSPLAAIDLSESAAAQYRRAYAELATAGPNARALFEALYEAYPEHPLVAFHYHRLMTGASSVMIVMDDK